MKRMKLFLGLFLGLLMFMSSKLFASAPDNNLITISSTTYTTISAEYEPREIYLGDPTTLIPVFYRIDGSTTNITTEGWWIPAGQGQVIELNSTIYLQLEAGESDITIRKMIIR